MYIVRTLMQGEVTYALEELYLDDHEKVVKT
jgi:hypothetical protein